MLSNPKDTLPHVRRQGLEKGNSASQNFPITKPIPGEVANAPDGIDAFHWLMDRGCKGKVLFFTGHARSNPQVALAKRNGVAILEKPVHPDKLISIVRRALNETQ